MFFRQRTNKKIVGKIVCVTILFTLSSLFSISCSAFNFLTTEEVPNYSMSFFAMNTHMHIQAVGNDAEVAVLAAVEEVYRLEKLFSRMDAQSEIYMLNQSQPSTSIELSEETFELISDALFFAQLTQGHFDPTIAPLMDLWGFTDGHYSIPSNSDIALAMQGIGYEKIAIHIESSSIELISHQIQLDLGGIAKGYASDRVIQILKTYDIDSAMINLGGNVYVYGLKSDGQLFRVAIADPIDRSAYAGILTVSDTSVITSGGYERYFEYEGEKYIHIMDPKTGQPVQSDLISVTIVDSSGVKGDALSTALFVMGLEEAISFYQSYGDFGCILIDRDQNVYVSENLKNIFIVNEDTTVYYFDRGEELLYGSIE